ncbi:MAG: HAD-IA family hydrolase [Patescibacteria group bacterium]
MENPKKKLIIFDIGRVLIGFDFAEFSDKVSLKSPRSPKEVERGIFESNDLEELHRGRISIEEFFKRFCHKLEITDFDVEEFKNLFLSIFFENQGIEEVLIKLNPSLKRMIISDISRFHWEEIISKNPILEQYFPQKEQRVLSFQEGVVKPEREIFQEALNRAGAEFKEAVFIDDKPSNVEGFRRLGGAGIHYDCTLHSMKELSKSLKEFSLLT